MTSHNLAVTSLILSLLSITTLLVGAYLFDTHLLPSKVSVFIVPGISSFGSMISLVLGFYSKDY